MKVAFVGKGGSGKSTMTALFLQYLTNKGQNILAIDADINMNLAGLLGVSVNEDILLANPQNAQNIREHLKGNNKRVGSADAFLPTTPPAAGSNIIRSLNDYIIVSHAQKISAEPTLNLMTVGTYSKEGIGQSCYHSDLFVAENILSHSFPKKEDWVVCDMVAGTDAFAYSLHLQFDMIILIAEPTPESVEVCKLYRDLAIEAGIENLIQIVANKIEDEDDIAFIKEKTGITPIAFIPAMRSLKKLRQSGSAINEFEMAEEITNAMEKIEDAVNNTPISEQDRLALLHKLHKKLSAKEWVKMGYGNVLDQIDPNFKVEEAA